MSWCWQRLGEDVCQHLGGLAVGKFDGPVFNPLTKVMHSDVNMTSTITADRILSDTDGALIILKQGGGKQLLVVQVAKQLPQIHGFLLSLIHI